MTQRIIRSELRMLIICSEFAVCIKVSMLTSISEDNHLIESKVCNLCAGESI
jgi:hypothetical protein